MKDSFYNNAPDFRVLFESLPGLFLVLLPDFTIAAASDEYLSAAMRQREEILGRNVFEVFSDDPILMTTDGARDLQISLRRVLETKKADKILMQRHDVQPTTKENGIFLKKYREVLNSPVLSERGEIRYIIHRVEDVTDRINAEKRETEQNLFSNELNFEAQAVRENLKQILSSITDSFYRFDRDFRYTYVNRATTEMFGIAEKDFLGKSLWDLFPDVEGNRFHDELKRVLEERRPAVFENYYQPLDRWFENRVYPSDDGLSVFTSEITTRKRNELKLQETSAVLNAINLNTPTLIYVKDRESRILSANPATCEVLGKSLTEIIGKSHTEYMGDPVEGEMIHANDLRIIESGKTETFEEMVTMPDGTHHVFLSTKTPYRDNFGETVGLIGVSVDITDRKAAEEALRETQNRLETSLRGAKLGVWTYNVQTGEFWADERAKRMHGYEANNILTFEQAGERIHPEDRERTQTAIVKSIENRTNLQVENRIIWRDGSIHWIASYAEFASSNDEGMFYGIVQDITRRKQAEEKLRAATEQFRVVAQVTNDAIWDWDLATDKLSWNEGVQTLFGYSPEQVSDSIAWWYEHIHPDDRDAVVEGIHEVIDAGGQQWSDEYRFVKEDGTFADVLDRGFILHDSSGKPVRMLGGMTDMTERRIAEEKLRESEEKFRDLADNISQLAWMAEASGSIFWYNERWYEYTGTTLAEMQGWGWQKVHHPDYVEHVTKSFKQSVDAGEAWEDTFPLRSKTGEYRWFLSRALPIRDADGKIIRWFGTNTDVTEIRNTRRELEEANALLDTLFDQAPIGFGYWDENLRFSRVNRALAEMNGFSVEEHLGKTVADLLPEVAEGVTEAFRHVVRTGEALINLEAEGKTPADLDEYRYWNVSYYPINLEGKIAGVGAVCEEITERKKAEVEREKLLASEQEARREAEQANRLKDEFLATVSHELRTPLNAILGWATIARQGGYKPEMMRSAFEIVERNARNQEQIIADILDVSRIITGKLNIEVESVELVSVVKAAIDTVRPTIEAKRINLAADFADQAQFVKGDPDRLQQIVWNLLSNAAKFTPEGGTVFVSLRRHEQFAEICVQDTGKGIEPEFLPFVFDRFRQAEGGSNRTHGGLGLGLSIVRHLVELHGGSVLVQSEGKNRGAKFVVMLPLFTSALSKESDGDISEIFESDRNQNNFPTAVNSNKLAGLYILAVDDEPDALELLKLMLETEGAVVTTAVSAAEALEKLQNAEFDVLISDLGMPGEDGFDLIRKIKSSNRYTKIPAIAVTAYARDEDSRRAVEAGFSAHLPKPVNGEDLTAMLRNLITN